LKLLTGFKKVDRRVIPSLRFLGYAFWILFSAPYRLAQRMNPKKKAFLVYYSLSLSPPPTYGFFLVGGGSHGQGHNAFLCLFLLLASGRGRKDKERLTTTPPNESLPRSCILLTASHRVKESQRLAVAGKGRTAPQWITLLSSCDPL
jgi:hypothetical protein